jgi:hypothetical protein
MVATLLGLYKESVNKILIIPLRTVLLVPVQPVQKSILIFFAGKLPVTPIQQIKFYE